MLILTDERILRRYKLHDEPQSDFVFADNQINSAVHDTQNTPILIETSRGYRYPGRFNQPITIFNRQGQPVEASLGQLRVGDHLPLRLGGLQGAAKEIVLPPLGEAYWTSDYGTRVPRRMTADLSEFLGYFMGDGSLHSKGIRLCVAQDDHDVIERLCRLGQELFGLQAMLTRKAGYIEVAFNSIRLVLWWEACDFAKTPPHEKHRGKGYSPHIPDAVLYSDNPDVYKAFIRGLFEADGTLGNHYVSWTTTSLSFSRDIQTLLLALGFISTRKFEKPTKTSWAVNTRFVLRLLNVSLAERFLREIGFMSQRKNTLASMSSHPQTARFDHIPISREEIDRLAPENDRLRKVLLLSASRKQTMTRRIGEQLLERTGDPKLKELLGFYYDEIVSVKNMTADDSNAGLT